MGRRAGHYVKRTGNMICERIALGETLEEALAFVGYLAPTEPQFWRWLDNNEDFRAQYERARQMQADKHADQIIMLGKKVLTKPKDANAFKVAIDVLKWSTEIRNAGKYGKKVESKTREPLDPTKIKAEIHRLETELGIVEGSRKPDNVVPLKSVGGSPDK